MEKFDVAVVGGGSAGLAALQQLSILGKQAVLIEAGKTIGSKNVSGGILYSKKPKNGKVFNVEDIYGEQFFYDAPIERLITKYMLHATSKDKAYSIDLTAASPIPSQFWLFCSLKFAKSLVRSGSQRIGREAGWRNNTWRPCQEYSIRTGKNCYRNRRVEGI